jgi:hypothetical protein
MIKMLVGIAVFVAITGNPTASESTEIGQVNPAIPDNCREVSGGLITNDYTVGFKRLLCSSTNPTGSHHVFWLQQFMAEKNATWKLVDILKVPIEIDGPKLLDPIEDGCKSPDKVGYVIAVARWAENDRGRTISNIDRAWRMPFFVSDERRFVSLAPDKVTCVPYKHHD